MGWSVVPLQLLVLLRVNLALRWSLLILDLLGDRLQLLRVQLGIQSAHLPAWGTGLKCDTAGQELLYVGTLLCYRTWTCCGPHLIFQQHPDRALLLQLLPQLDHLPPQVLGLFLLQNVRRADPFIFLLSTPPLRGRSTQLLRTNMDIFVRWTLKTERMAKSYDGFVPWRCFTCMIRLSWLFCCNSRVFSCSKVKMYSAVCCRMAAWAKEKKNVNPRNGN